jgi:hypothetical protein
MDFPAYFSDNSRERLSAHLFFSFVFLFFSAPIAVLIVSQLKFVAINVRRTDNLTVFIIKTLFKTTVVDAKVAKFTMSSRRGGAIIFVESYCVKGEAVGDITGDIDKSVALDIIAFLETEKN